MGFTGMGLKMNRLNELRKFVRKTDLGLEIAPYFNPAVSKADGYNVAIVDVFDTETLRRRARGDSKIPEDKIAEIEEVDLVSDASQLARVVKSNGLSSKVSYIVSSHNFEHLPDPISFLQGCSEALVPGGVLSMAIPDCRACFDYFRMPTRLSDWLGAYHGAYTQPTPEVMFDSASNRAPYNEDTECFIPVQNLKSTYKKYLSDIDVPGPYRDTHCSVVFGPSFELMIRDLKFFGLIDLEVVEVSPTSGIEFFAHLRKPDEKSNGAATVESDEVFFTRREELMRQVNSSLSTRGVFRTSDDDPAKRFMRRALGESLFRNLRDLNARRRVKRRRRRS